MLFVYARMPYRFFMTNDSPTPITTSDALAAYCAEQANSGYLAVDTEFVRESTYYPILCLVQVAGDTGEAVAIDTMADGLDLGPLYDLLANPKILKVFHAARQDLEIFYNKTGSVPAPIFDTQVAAMVCGLGDQIGYEPMIGKLLNQAIDKSSRFTDWSKRPLSERQISYALSDVIYLRPAYEKLRDQLKKNNRAGWLDEEMAVLTSAETYRMDPADAWKRIKSRGLKARGLAILQEIAAWREAEAQRRDMPRNRLLRDDTLLDIAGSAPTNAQALSRIRGLSKGHVDGSVGKAIIEAVTAVMERPKESLPRPEKRDALPQGIGPVSDMLKILLKQRCEDAGIVSRLVANADELNRLAAGETDGLPALSGWRHELFGKDALDLKAGRLALTVQGNKVEILPMSDRKSSGTGAEA
ncbi:MAG: ribonuclease D [Alphaproteobacteria bacterium]